MSEKERDSMGKLSEILPKFPPSKLNYLLGYGDAIADMKEEERNKEKGGQENGSNDDSGDRNSG